MVTHVYANLSSIVFMIKNVTNAHFLLISMDQIVFAKIAIILKV